MDGKDGESTSSSTVSGNAKLRRPPVMMDVAMYRMVSGCDAAMIATVIALRCLALEVLEVLLCCR